MESLHRKFQWMTLSGLLLTTFAAEAQSPPIPNLSAFAGTWKEDTAKTVRKPEDAVRQYTQNADGTMSVTIDGTYHDAFRIDGKPHPVMPRPDVQQTWKQMGPSAWESTNTKDGQVEETIRRTISSDGMTLTLATAQKTDSGQAFTKTTIYTRSSAEKNGLVGTWKTVSLHVEPPDVISLRIKSDGLVSYSALDGSFLVKPDGEKHTLKSEESTASLQAFDERKMEFTFFWKAKLIDIYTLSLSADGQSLTAIERDPANNQAKATLIYQRQK